MSLLDDLAVCDACGAVILNTPWATALHAQYHEHEGIIIAAEPDLEAERVTHSGETHSELARRVRKERIDPSWKEKGKS